MKRVAIERRIGKLLKKFIESTGETFTDSLHQAVLDYVNIMLHVSGTNPDTELLRIMSDFEIDVQLIQRQISQVRREYLKVRKDESILLDKDIPHTDNSKYMILEVSPELYNAVVSLIRRYPYMYSDDKKASIKDVLDRSVIFRTMVNEKLMRNSIYRAWRLEQIMRQESKAKLNMEDVLGIVSQKRRVVWNE